MMEPWQIWQLVLDQLREEMPRASYETWAKDTEAVALEEDQLTIAVRNAYARDRLEVRLTSTIQRLLIGILNQSVSVRFVVSDTPEAEVETDVEEPDEPELGIEPVQWLDYDQIVQPHKQVVVKGYLRRLGMEIGPKAIWLYIGFHQAAWLVHAQGKESGLALHSRDVMRFSGLSFGAFWRSLRHEGLQSSLQGLVQRLDEPQVRCYRRGRDGRPHRRPVRYQVSMTPRLTHTDAAAIYARLKSLLNQGLSMAEALRALLGVADILEILESLESAPSSVPCHTVMDMARWESGENFSPDIDHLAQELHRRITNCLGDIHIPHYFITETIQRYNLTPAQAWLITVARDMAYINARTGERREVVTFKRGYQEMAELIDSSRYKTVQAWLNPAWTSQQRGGNLKRFLMEIEQPDSSLYADLRVDTMPRTFRVLLDEPLDASGIYTLGANGNHMTDAHGSISRRKWYEYGGRKWHCFKLF